MHTPFYSAPSIFAVFKPGSRNLVQDIWFEKSGSKNLVRKIWFKKSGSANSDFFSGSRKVIDQKNRWVYTINTPFFRFEISGSANSDSFSGSRTVFKPWGTDYARHTTVSQPDLILNPVG